MSAEPLQHAPETKAAASGPEQEKPPTESSASPPDCEHVNEVKGINEQSPEPGSDVSPASGDSPPFVKDVNEVNQDKGGALAQRRVYSEPIFEFEGDPPLVKYVGKPEPDEGRRKLFGAFGTSLMSMHRGMIWLPTKEADYGSPEKLHQATLAFINRYCQLQTGMDVVAAWNGM